MEIEVFTQTVGGTIALELPTQAPATPHLAEIHVDIETSIAETFNPGPAWRDRTYSAIPVRRDHKAHVTITLDLNTTIEEASAFAEYLREGMLGSLAFISQPTMKKETK